MCAHQETYSVCQHVEGGTLVGISFPAVMDNSIPVRGRLMQVRFMEERRGRGHYSICMRGCECSTVKGPCESMCTGRHPPHQTTPTAWAHTTPHARVHWLTRHCQWVPAHWATLYAGKLYVILSNQLRNQPVLSHLFRAEWWSTQSWPSLQVGSYLMIGHASIGRTSKTEYLPTGNTKCPLQERQGRRDAMNLGCYWAYMYIAKKDN